MDDHDPSTVTHVRDLRTEQAKIQTETLIQVSLPQELIDEVVGQLIPHVEGDFRTLLACSRTSTSFLAPARKGIFRDLALSSTRRVREFKRLIHIQETDQDHGERSERITPTPSAKDIPRYVRNLRFPLNSSLMQDAKFVNELVILLRSECGFTDVHHIQFETRSPCTVSGRFILLAALKRVECLLSSVMSITLSTRLRVNGWEGFGMAQPPFLEFAFSFPELRTITVDGGVVPTCALETGREHDLGVMGYPRITHIALGGDVDNAGFLRLLPEPVRSQVVSLRLERYHHAELAVIMEMLPRIALLSVGEHTKTWIEEQSTAVSSARLPPSCSHLQKLHFTITISIDHDLEVELGQTGSFPATYHWWRKQIVGMDMLEEVVIDVRFTMPPISALTPELVNLWLDMRALLPGLRVLRFVVVSGEKSGLHGEAERRACNTMSKVSGGVLSTGMYLESRI